MAKPKPRSPGSPRELGTRQDPHRRMLSVKGWNELTNQDPEADYVWAFAGHQSGRDTYLALGYEVATYTVDGVRPAGMLNAPPEHLLTKPIEWNGHLLMQAPKALKESRVWHGDNGVTGRQYAEQLAEQIHGEGLAREAAGTLGKNSRGRRFIKVENETEPAYTE